MSSAAVGTHSSIGPLSLMSCVRESSPLQDSEEHEKNTSSKKKFWNPKKWFRRKNKAVEEIVSVEITNDKDAIRSRSTSELSIADEQQSRRRSGSSMHPGLSVSHDSVFHSPNSGSDIELGIAQSSSSLSISQPHIELRLQTELSKKLRLRRNRGTGDTSEDDEGFPNSPCNSPTTTETLLNKTSIKDLPTKSHSTCSDGSLLSMCSSENDEEPVSQQSRHSSKLSLHDKSSATVTVVTLDTEIDLDAPNSSDSQLNHSAAHHRVAVRPKRRAPHRNKRIPQLSAALPITPEVNEDASNRSITPETIPLETVTETRISCSERSLILSESQLKCSSLPPGLTAPDDDSKLSRSHSNVGSKSQEHFLTSDEPSEKDDKSGDKSFFDRIFPRRSAKKRKSKEERANIIVKQHESKPPPSVTARSGATARQRIPPIDLPPSPETVKKDYSVNKEANSPLHDELESRFKQMNSPVKLKSIESTTVITKSSDVVMKTKSEEIGSKIKIPNLSSLQQRVLSRKEEDDNNWMDDESCVVEPQVTHKEILENKSEINNTLYKEKQTIVEQKVVEKDDVDEKIIKDVTDNFNIKLDDFCDDITISGPSHTAVVHISDSAQSHYKSTTTKSEKVTSGDLVKDVTTNESVSITKIHLKRESTQVTQSTVTVPNSALPEFFNKQLNKVDTKPSTNVVFSTNAPRVVEEKPKIIKNIEDDKMIARKFSKEEVEIVEKSDDNAVMAPKFKKNDKRKTSTSDSPKNQYTRSFSIESIKTDVESSDKSSLDSLEILDSKDDSDSGKKERSTSAVENVVMRKKHLIKHKNEDEPELMKVFARRSLKLKDTEAETVSQAIEKTTTTPLIDSDKENQVSSSSDDQISLKETQHIKTSENSNREPLVEAKVIDLQEEKKFTETTEVTLRKPVNFPPYNYQRAKSVNLVTSKSADEALPIKKQQSFSDRRKTDNNWKSSINNNRDDVIVESRISQDEILTGISPKCDLISDELITEQKNFNQRKAEWEKRAQQAQKKSVP